MGRAKKIPEELIKEAYKDWDILQQVIEAGGGPETARMIAIERTIRRTLLAFDRGDLDDFLGVIGRDIMARLITDNFEEGIVMEGDLRYNVKPGDIIIALRRKEFVQNSLFGDEE